MNKDRPEAAGGFSKMGIPLAGGTSDGPDADDRPRVEALDFDGEVGDIAEGLRPLSHGVYETPEEVGLSLLVENTGTRAFERVEVRVGVGGGTVESVATSGGGDSAGSLPATGGGSGSRSPGP